MWKVRLEIIGEFVVVEKFETVDEAEAFAIKRYEDGIYDTVKMWEE